MTGPTPHITDVCRRVPPYTETCLLNTLSTAASPILHRHITRGAHGTLIGTFTNARVLRYYTVLLVRIMHDS